MTEALLVQIPATLLAVSFGGLSLLHLYWAFGGPVGATVPEKDGVPLFQPGPIACIAVAIALATAALIALAKGGILLWIPAPLSGVGIWVLVAVFTLRAVGDFRYIGLFKRVTGTRFARLDSRVYSPLCAALAMLALWLGLVA